MVFFSNTFASIRVHSRFKPLLFSSLTKFAITCANLRFGSISFGTYPQIRMNQNSIDGSRGAAYNKWRISGGIAVRKRPKGGAHDYPTAPGSSHTEIQDSRSTSACPRESPCPIRVCKHPPWPESAPMLPHRPYLRYRNQPGLPPDPRPVLPDTPQSSQTRKK